jgi:hypothetical protein
MYVVLCTCAFGLRDFTVLKYRPLSQCTMEAKKQFLTYQKIYQYNAIMRNMCVCVDTSNTCVYVITEIKGSAKLVDKVIR